MSRKQKKTGGDVSAVLPVPMSRDELEALTRSELEALAAQLRSNRQTAEVFGGDTRPWEVEISYVDLAAERRARYEAITPRALWA